MSGTDVDLTTLLEDAMRLALENADGPTYGFVETYDPTKQRAKVVPQIPRLKPDGGVEIIAVLPNVPVEWPETTTHGIKMPLGPGSAVRLQVLGHDHDQWITSGTPNVSPTTRRRFSLSDVVAIPAAPLPFSVTADPLTYDAAWAVMTGGWVVGDNTGTFVALAGMVLTELQAIKTWADLHQHDVAAVGGYNIDGTPVTGMSGIPSSAPGVPNPMPAPSSVACTKLKAK